MVVLKTTWRLSHLRSQVGRGRISPLPPTCLWLSAFHPLIISGGLCGGLYGGPCIIRYFPPPRLSHLPALSVTDCLDSAQQLDVFLLLRAEREVGGAGDLGERGPLSQGVQAGRNALRIRYIHGIGRCIRRGPRGSSEPPEPRISFSPPVTPLRSRSTHFSCR